MNITPNPEDEAIDPEYFNNNLEQQQQPEQPGGHQIIRQGKLIIYNRPPNPRLDETVVTLERYNCFGRSLSPNRGDGAQFVAGVISPNRGEGKSLVAANLATFFALDALEDTVLIDLNFSNPSVHKIFGINQAPGVRDAFVTDTVTIWRTAVRGLWVLPVGEAKHQGMAFDSVIGLREVISTVKEKFRFVIVDLPSVSDPTFSKVMGSYVDGYVVVVSAGATKKADVAELVATINENKIIGFVVNRASKGMANL